MKKTKNNFPARGFSLASALKLAISIIICSGFILIFPRSEAVYAATAKIKTAETAAMQAAKASAMYEKALKDYKDGRFAHAYRYLEFILNNYETTKNLSSDVYFLCGKILYKMGNLYMAKPYFQRIIYKDPDYKKIYNVIFYMARTDFNLKNYRRSIRDFDFLLSKSKKGDELYDRSLIYLTLSYASCGRTKKADNLYKKDDVKKILKKTVYLKKRNNYFKQVYLDYLINHKNDLSDAIITLSIKNLFSPKKKDMCYKPYYIGLIAYKENKYPIAEKYFIDSTKYCSGYYHKIGLLYYGMAAVKQKNLAGLNYIKRDAEEIEYPKMKLKALKFIAGYYHNENKPAEELKYLKRLLFDFSNMTETKKIRNEKKASALIYGIIKSDYKNRHFDDAFKSLNKIEFLIPPEYINPKTYLYLSKIKLKQKDEKTALIYAEKYDSLSKSPRSKYFLASIYFKLDAYNRSFSLIKDIVLKNIKNLELRNKIINLKLELYKRLNYRNNYINLLKTSLNLLPPQNKIKNLYFLGREEFDKKNLKAAYKYFYKAVKNNYAEEKNNKNILHGAYYYLGLISYSNKNYKLSLEYFNKSYKIDSSGKHFQYELSQIAYIYSKYLKNKRLALKYYAALQKNASSATYKTLASSMISAINMQK